MSRLYVEHRHNNRGDRHISIELDPWRFRALWDDTLHHPTLAYAELVCSGENGNMVWLLEYPDDYDSLRDAFRWLRHMAAFELRQLAAKVDPFTLAQHWRQVQA